MHCDVVIAASPGGDGRLYTVGGNVLQGVTLRMLNLNRNGMPWPLPRGSNAGCTPANEAACNFNRQNWAALLKLKPLHDAEAVVIGHVPGQGKHAGRLGALRVRNEDGAEFLIGTGFSDAQRAEPPPTGVLVTYTHRGSTASGVPRFASFLRVRDDL